MRKAKALRKIRWLNAEREAVKKRMNDSNQHSIQWHDFLRDEAFLRIDQKFLEDVALLKTAPRPWYYPLTRMYKNAVRRFNRGAWQRRELAFREKIMFNSNIDIVERVAYTAHSPTRIPAPEMAQVIVDTFYRDYDGAMEANKPL